MADTALMRELEFTLDDLAANRSGKLSERQLDRLRMRRQRSMFYGSGIVVALAFAASLCLFGGLRGSAILTVVGLGLAVCATVVMSTFARYWLRISADLREGAASAFSGPLERVVKPVNRRIVTYLLRVESAEFSVTKETFKLFDHEKPYALYRAKFSGLLLSAERL